MSTVVNATEVSAGGGGGSPTGSAGGDLGGTYPNPSVTDDSHAHTSSTVTPAGIGAAPSTVDYLVGTASAGLSAEIAVGTTPGGELGGTWASPTVDATHSGSAHHAQSHDHSASGDGQSLSPVTLNLPVNGSAPTAAGRADYATASQTLRIGSGSSTASIFAADGTAPSTQAFGDAAATGSANAFPRRDHKHAMPALGYGLSGTSTAVVGLTTAEAFATAETTLSASSYADIAGASISLAAGTWLIMATVNGRVVNAHALMLCAITDGTGVIVANGSQSIPASGTASVNAVGNVSMSVIVSPGSTTTYKLRGARGNTTLTTSWIAMDGSAVAVANNASDGTDKGTSIRAIRLA